MRNPSLFSVALLLLVASSCLCRPQTTIDSQQPDVSLSTELEVPSSSDSAQNAAWRKLYLDPSLQQRYQSMFEEARQQQQQASLSPLERLQLDFIRMAQQQQQQNAISGGSSGLSVPWESMYRMPEMKRQVRYRQCYFNPISCFKK